jgi:hypothetical protein
VVDSLDADYSRQRKPVVFVEHLIDDCRTGNPCVGSADRLQIFRAADPNANTLPLQMSDSGQKTRWGNSSDFEREMRQMIDPELRRLPQVEIAAYFQRVGNTAKVQAYVTNRSGGELTTADRAQVWAILYEEKKVIHTSHYVRAVKSVMIMPDLRDGETGTYELEIAGTGGMNWSKAHILVLVDMRRPNGVFDTLQAALAEEGQQPTPTETETPEATPTETEAPTEVPTATATETPPDTPTPTLEPTEEPTDYYLYLPSLYDNVDTTD